MKFLLPLAFVLAAVAAEEIFVPPHILVQSYPEWYIGSEPLERHRRDVTVDKKIGDGRVYGTLGDSDAGLYGKAGYERNLFNDHRGKLDAEVYGQHVLDTSSQYGGALNWKDDHATATLDLNRQIGGPTSLNAAAGGRWPVGRGGEMTAQGTYDTTFHGRPDYGVMFGLKYPW